MPRPIAAALRIGDRTVERRVTDIYRKGTIGPCGTAGVAARALLHQLA